VEALFRYGVTDHGELGGKYLTFALGRKEYGIPIRE
jgi:hypothetical protein